MGALLTESCFARAIPGRGIRGPHTAGRKENERSHPRRDSIRVTFIAVCTASRRTAKCKCGDIEGRRADGRGNGTPALSTPSSSASAGRGLRSAGQPRAAVPTCSISFEWAVRILFFVAAQIAFTMLGLPEAARVHRFPWKIYWLGTA